MSALEAPVAPESTEERLDRFFGERAADVDAGHASVRDGIALLGELGLADADLEASAALIARVARSDLASAFSAWAHRMVLEYLALAPAGTSLQGLRPDLRSGRLLGATALAAGTARHLAGTPLPVTFRQRGGTIHLDGRVPWASNLLPPFVAVTAAADADDDRRAIVVAFTDRTPGVTIAPYPEILALGATGSSAIGLSGAVVPADFIVAEDLGPFVERVLPPFLLLQSAFCIGLAVAALDATSAYGGSMNAVLHDDTERLRAAVALEERRLRELARRAGRAGARAIPRRDLLRLRLRAAHLAGDSVRIELASAGGRGYLRGSPTARRVREAAFLPVQSPTEVQLRWILSRSA